MDTKGPRLPSRDIAIHESIEDFLAVDRQVGEDGATQLWVGRTPFQQLWIEWVSIEDLAWHIEF